jgi:tetratricopeptide (TPR) repeat protein
MIRIKGLIISCTLAIFAGAVPHPCNAQTPAPADAAEAAANAAYAAKNWPEAEQMYSSLAQQKPDSARFQYRLGTAERANGHYEAALKSFARAKELGAGKGLPGPVADYEIATTYAAMGNGGEALRILKGSADGGFSQPSRLDSDPEWSAYRQQAEFVASQKVVKHNAAPCDDAEFAQFDFWVGDWDVASTADGIPRGTSHISKEMAGCVIWENWTSAGSGYFGKSYNTYNVNLQRWEQYWVDNVAGTMFFYGHLQDGVMDYWTDDVPQPGGQKMRRHLQFFNQSPDQVRQFSQKSMDGGKTWTVEYDLTYKRHGAASSGTR